MNIYILRPPLFKSIWALFCRGEEIPKCCDTSPTLTTLIFIFMDLHSSATRTTAVRTLTKENPFSFIFAIPLPILLSGRRCSSGCFSLQYLLLDRSPSIHGSAPAPPELYSTAFIFVLPVQEIRFSLFHYYAQNFLYNRRSLQNI